MPLQEKESVRTEGYLQGILLFHRRIKHIFK